MYKRFPPKKNANTTSETVSPLFRFNVETNSEPALKVREHKAAGKSCADCPHYRQRISRCTLKQKQVLHYSICHHHGIEVLK